MKYTILINQYAAVNSGLDLDLIDLAIFDFIKDFANCSNCVKMHTPEGIYFWISHKLQKHPNCELYNKTLYCFGENYELLTFTEKGTYLLIGVDTPKQKFTPPLNKSLEEPINESLGYNSNNTDKTNKDKDNPDNIVIGNLFPEEPKVEEPKEKKTLFRNSAVYKMVKFENGVGVDYSEFESKFAPPEFEKVDLERNKLHLKPQFQQSKSKINVSDAVKYLNDDF